MMADTIKTPIGDAPVMPLVILGIGGYLTWFGIHYWRSDVKYPTTPIKDILQGKGSTPAGTAPISHQAQLISDVQSASAAETGATGTASTSYPGGQPPAVAGAGGNPAANKNLGKLLASTYGWNTGNEWNALVSLWDRESGWSNTADTRVTHAGGDNSNSVVFAYGIPQARPYSKMPKVAWPPDKGGNADPSAQITWGLLYLKQAYGDPVKAWQHEQSNGWY